MTWLETYWDEINAGHIVVGFELHDMLARLIDDIHSGAWTYDTHEADLRLAFMERFVKLTKSPFYGKPMKLMLWQKAFIEALYSFKRPDGRDRFRRAILLIARKNTKSETCSALALTEFMVGNSGSDIVCASNDERQSSIIYDAIDVMRCMFDPKDEMTHKNISMMTNVLNGSRIFKLSNETKRKEGLNIDFAILDESHELKDNVVANSILQSQSLKPNPKFINITTEGFTTGGYLDEQLEHARKVINGEREDDGLLPWLYTQDSETEVWTNPASWAKSNPSLGMVKQTSYLEEQLQLAKYSKQDRMFVLAKDFNIKQNAAQSWLNLEDYDYEATFNPEDFAGCMYVGGVDMSETTDLTCAKALILRDGIKYVLTKYFIPESKLGTDESSGARYQEWVDAGLMEVTEGNDNDLTKVADWYYSLYQQYQMAPLKVGYDQRFSRDFLKRMDEYGFDCEMVLQNRYTMSNAMKLLESDLKARRVNYDRNPIDMWCLSNACMSMDNLGQVMAVKINGQHEKRIDGAVTFIIAYEMFRRYRSELTEMDETTR